MVGFFSSESLSALAPGLASYISNASAPLRLIASPYINERDRQAIEEGISSVDDMVIGTFSDLLITKDLLQQHTLKCLSYLLRIGRLEIKIALMKDALFHPKVWLFCDGSDFVAVHGSSNMTNAGVRKNFEQITISKSWLDPTQRFIVNKLKNQFEKLWKNEEESCLVISAPEAIKEQIMSSYPEKTPPSEDDYHRLYKKAQDQTDMVKEPGENFSIITPVFKIPSYLEYEEGPFEHQGRAVEAWCSSDFRGVLEMATGSGKTIAAMICAFRLAERHKPLLITVAAPYVPLISQWCREIEPFGLQPHNLTTVNGAKGRSRKLQQIKRRLHSGLSDVEVIVVSHDTLCDAEFKKTIEFFDCSHLLIADEAHNLGRPNFISDTPDFFEYRLGLSATPIRQYDEEGTEALLDYFGPIVFRFPLEDAIGKCLVEYDYFVHPVELTADEMDQWYEITRIIKANAWRQKDGKPDDYLAKLFRDRRVLLETAAGKLTALSELLRNEDVRKLKHTLIYATDKEPGQLEEVNSLLDHYGILFHQLTAEETRNREETMRIIKSFQEGEIQVLTAKRVLDEGVNIPQICKAFILASTTVERQWIQRRGRLLRKCNEIGKTHSEIHDFIALPSNMDKNLDKEARSLIKSELSRVQEFAALARNAGRPGGPLSVIDRLVKAAYW